MYASWLYSSICNRLLPQNNKIYQKELINREELRLGSSALNGKVNKDIMYVSWFVIHL